jgi:hypothetical protein
MSRLRTKIAAALLPAAATADLGVHALILRLSTPRSMGREADGPDEVLA